MKRACKHPKARQHWVLCEDNGEGEVRIMWCMQCGALWCRHGWDNLPRGRKWLSPGQATYGHMRDKPRKRKAMR